MYVTWIHFIIFNNHSNEIIFYGKAVNSRNNIIDLTTLRVTILLLLLLLLLLSLIFYIKGILSFKKVLIEHCQF